MNERIHRYAPEGAFPRLLLALLVLTGSLLVTFLGLFPLLVFVAGNLVTVTSLALVLLLFPGVRGLQAAYHLARGVADQAEAAPASANPARNRAAAEDDADDPVRLLQQRYARGELDGEAFESRMQRLLESDRRPREVGDRRHGPDEGRGGREPGEPALE